MFVGRPKFIKDSKALLAIKKKKLIALAKAIPDRDRRVLPLAQAFHVSAPTARAWLDEAGITTAARRGRPGDGESYTFKDVQQLLKLSLEQARATRAHGQQVLAENPQGDDDGEE